jgi:hypothetical protein
MSAGLPALALGGALYLLLIVWMLVRGLLKTASFDRSAPSQWPFVGKMVFVLLAMVVVVLGERVLIKYALELAILYIPWLTKFRIVSSTSFVALMVLLPFIILLLIVGCLHGLRFSRRPSRTRLQRFGLAQSVYRAGRPVQPTALATSKLSVLE